MTDEKREERSREERPKCQIPQWTERTTTTEGEPR